jgi:hypothetical protein
MIKNFKLIVLFLPALVFYTNTFSQISTGQLTGQVNVVSTAVPFLLIAADSRAGAMGDAGVATLPDANSMQFNPSKYSFIKTDFGVSASYTPWLRALIDDINLMYLAGYKKFANDQVLSLSLKYFSLGSIIFTDMGANVIGQFNPNEYSIDAAYSRLFSKNFSGSLAFRYIYSNLTGGQYVGGQQSHAGKSVASDISVYYRKNIDTKGFKSILGFGLNVSNIGAKISYSQNANKDFLPTQLKLGSAYNFDIDNYNSIGLTVEFSKLLVPTPPIFYHDSVDENNKPVIEYGMDPNVGPVVGMYQSFYDAPGVAKDPLHPESRNVLQEEFREINYSIGAEYWYAKQFCLRAGYFYEHPTKGNRNFFTVGLGLRLNVFGLDFSYLIPTQQRNPLENTLRFTLTMDFEKEKKDKTTTNAK